MMKDGLIRVAAATPDVRVADPKFNGDQVIRLMEEGYEDVYKRQRQSGRAALWGKRRSEG